MITGAQMYTVREFTKTLDDFAETLRKIADIGYKTVQVSGTCAYEPEWLRGELAKNGLQCVITHTPADRMVSDPDAVCREHSVFDCRYIGIGWYDLSDAEKLAAFTAKFKPVAKNFAGHGKLLMYHNHDHEFAHIGNETILEQVARAFSSEELGITLDTYWVQNGGGDPAWWIRHLSGRVPCVHLKDMNYGHKMAPVGHGNMNFGAILPACADAGAKYLLVEQDDCYGEDPFDCLKKSYLYLQAQGLR